MLNINRIEHVYLVLGPTDFRKSINGLAVLVQESFNLDPFSRLIPPLISLNNCFHK